MDTTPIVWLILLQFVFIALNAIFACAEIAVISMNDNRLAQLTAEGDKRAVRLSRLTAQPAGFLATIQVGITLVNLLSSAVATENFSDRLVAWLLALGISVPRGLVQALSMALITIVLTYFTVLLGELIPKRLAMKKAEEIALGMSGLIYVVSKIFTPVVWLFTVSPNGLLRLMGVDPNSTEDSDPEEEIRLLLDAGKQQGTIQAEERSMIQNIFEFDDISAEDIMTHRTEVAMLWLDDTDQQWEQTINQVRHTAYPICDETPDKIVGILDSEDYLRLNDRSRHSVMLHAVKPAYFVPETVRADVLFQNMKKAREYFAVVVDEYGGMSGIVTINDLLEQLVGDLDEDASLPQELPPIQKLDANTWRVRGSAPLEDVAAQLGVSLPVEDYDTFSGYVFNLLGMIPRDGSTPEVQDGGLTIKISQIKGHRLESAVVCRAEPAPVQEAAARA